MSDDTERLVVALEARIRDFEKNMMKAEGTGTRTYKRLSAGSSLATRQMEGDMVRSTTRINQALAATGSRIGDFGKAFAVGLVSAAGLRSAQQLIDAATRIENALKVAGLAGDDLTTVYDQLFASAQRNAAPMEALVTLYGRASLVQKELGVSQSELLGFTDKIALALRVSGQSAEQSSGALLQLSQALGSGTIRAEEFNSILEGALPIAQAAAAGLEEAGGSVSKLRALVVDGKVSSEAFFRAFEAGAVILEDEVAGAQLTVSQQFIRLQNVLTDTAGKIDKATGASKIMVGVLDELATGIRGFGNVVSEVSDSDLGKFLGWLSSGIDKVNEFKRVMGGIPGVFSTFSKINSDIMNGRDPGASMKEEQIQSRINQAFDEPAALPKTGRLPSTQNVKTVSLDDYAVPGGKGGTGARSSAKTAIDTERKAVVDLIAELEEELRLVNATDAEKRKAAATREAGAAATADERQKIVDLTEAIHAESEARELALDRIETQKDMTRQALGDLKSALDDGKISWQELGDIAIGVLDRIADKLLDDVVDSIFSGSGDPKSGGGGLFSFLTGSILRRAGGGPVSGPGGPKDDRIPAYLSNGEFVVNADATRKNRSILQAINAGMPAFKEGGFAMAPGDQWGDELYVGNIQ